MGSEYQSLRKLTEDLRLVTVCEEAGCPNIFECWSAGTATFMVNGERCTRACGFCLVDTRKPLALDPTEPDRVAEAVVRLNLAHAVITCVARDDLHDGGAASIASSVRAIRERSPGTDVEVLTSDLRGDFDSLQILLNERPDVLNHNIETVARLQRAVRPSAGYLRSLTVLARSAHAGLTTKSGLMVGLGETVDEVEETLSDLAAVGVSIVTIGQYLRPTERHLPVARFWEPAEFEDLAERGRRLGLRHVQSSPLTRSSYHAREALSEATRWGRPFWALIYWVMVCSDWRVRRPHPRAMSIRERPVMARSNACKGLQVLRVRHRESRMRRSLIGELPAPSFSTR